MTIRLEHDSEIRTFRNCFFVVFKNKEACVQLKEGQSLVQSILRPTQIQKQDNGLKTVIFIEKVSYDQFWITLVTPFCTLSNGMQLTRIYVLLIYMSTKIITEFMTMVPFQRERTNTPMLQWVEERIISWLRRFFSRLCREKMTLIMISTRPTYGPSV